MNCKRSLMLVLAISLVCIPASVVAVGWSVEEHTAGVTADLRGISVVSGLEAWAVGESGVVLRRDHSGWSAVDNLPLAVNDWDFEAIEVAHGNTIWIVGQKRHAPNAHQGIIMKSSDSGVTWRKFYPPVPEGYPATAFMDVYFLNDGYGWIAASSGLILRTRDAGNTWQVQRVLSFSDHFQSIWGEGADKAWACSDNSGGVARTDDGGATWQTDEPFPAEYNLPEIDPGQNYSRATAALWAAAFDTAYVALSEGRVGRTADGGKTWAVQAVAPKAVWFKDVWGKGRYVWAVGTSGEIYFSDTGGEMWKSEHGDEDFHLNDVDMADDLSGYGWAVGTNGTILRRVPKAFPDLYSETNHSAPFVDIGWEINPDAAVDSFQLFRNFENCHEDPSGYLVTLDFVQGLGEYVYVDFHEHGGCCSYYYWLRTFYKDGEFDIQGPLTARARGSAIPVFPPSPGTVIANRTPHGVILTWGPTGFHTTRVYRSAMSSGPFTYIGETSQSHYLDSEVDEAATYFYLLRAAGAELTSPDSPLASVGPQEGSYEVSTEIDPTGTYFDVANQIAYFSWCPVSDFMLGGYWISLNDSSGVRELMNSSALSRDWYGVKYSSSLPASALLEYGVLPMDRVSRLSQWHDYRVPVGVSNVSSDDATKGNNTTKLIERDGILHIIYSDGAGDESRIQYTSSTDGGHLWAEPTDLGKGTSPALASNSFGLHAIWVDSDWTRITYARKVEGSWHMECIFEVDDWLSPPSFVVDEMSGYLATVMKDSVCWGEFSLHHPDRPEWYRISNGCGSAFGPRASIDLDSDGLLHISYSCSDGEIYYWSEYTDPGCVNISKSAGASRFPSLDAEGSVVRVVWEEQHGLDWVVNCWQLFEAPDTSLWDMSCLGECGPGNSSLQPTIRGNRVLWMDNGESAGSPACPEIYGSTFRHDSSFIWEECENHSEIFWAPSLYPQLAVRGRNLYGVWTEGVAPHKWIRFERKDIYDRNIAFYKVGGILPGRITLARDGYFWHGDRAFMKVDYSADELVYRIEGLETDSTYSIGVGFYQQGEAVSYQVVRADGEVLGVMAVPAGKLSYLEESVPRSVTCDGTVELAVRNSAGGEAVVSHISIDYDEPGGSGPQSVYARAPGEDPCSLLDATPNPFGGSVKFSFSSAPENGRQSITIYDAAGRLVSKLPITASSIVWNGRSCQGKVLPAGVYFARVGNSARSHPDKLVKLR